MSPRGAPFLIYVALGLTCWLLLPDPAQAQGNSFRDQAFAIAKQEFANSWLNSGDMWFLYFEVPPNTFTPVVGQEGTSRGYAQAFQITANNAVERQINEADLANGLRWHQEMTFVATRARLYHFASGWTEWIYKPPVMAIVVENRNNQWLVQSTYTLPVPANATYRRPAPNELPGDGEGPRASPSVPGPAACAVACQASDAFCSSVKQKMTELSACGGQGADINLYNRFSDAGWFYCNQKRNGTDAAMRDFESRRPPASPVEAQLDSFAIGAASQYRCRQ